MAQQAMTGLTLEEVRSLTFEELRGALESGEPPEPGELLGEYRGEVHFRLPRRKEVNPRGAAIARAITGWVWLGKVFDPPKNGVARGRNRIRVGPRVVHRLDFEARVDRSRATGLRGLILDYDLPENPRVLRPTLDEIRRIGPAVYLGLANVKGRRGRMHSLLYWTLQPLAGA